MYNNAVENYIRNIIGRNPENTMNSTYNLGNNIFENDFDYYRQMPNDFYMSNAVSDTVNLEEYYPETYKLIYPMIKKVCMKTTGTISQKLIDDMVEEVYSNFVEDTNIPVQLNINLNNDVRRSNTVSQQNSDNSLNTNNTEIANKKEVRSNNNTNIKETHTSSIKNIRGTESKSDKRVSDDIQNLHTGEEENRQYFVPRNSLLNDLIRILILRELLGRPGGNFTPPSGRPLQRPPHNNYTNRPRFLNRQNYGMTIDSRLNLTPEQYANYNSYPDVLFEEGYV